MTNNGKVVTISLLDRERRDSYSIVLNISDHGSPPLQVGIALCITTTISMFAACIHIVIFDDHNS